MSDKEFVIATFNLENLDDKDKLWPKHPDALKPMLERLEADLLFLQEVNTVEALNEILRDSCYEGYEQTITKTEEGHSYKERNLVILSRYKIQSTNQYLNHFTRPPMWRQITEEAEGEITEKKSKEVLWERPSSIARYPCQKAAYYTPLTCISNRKYPAISKVKRKVNTCGFHMKAGQKAPSSPQSNV